MDPRFADWYRDASIDPKAETLGLRSNGVDVFLKELNDSHIPELVRMFYGIPGKHSDFEPLFRSFFKSQDETFPTRDNDLEMRVLAGTAIALQFSSHPSKQTDKLALLMVSASFRNVAIVKEILVLAQVYLRDRSAMLREMQVEAQEPQTDATGLIQTLIEHANSNNMKAGADSLKKILELYNSRSETHQILIQRLTAQIELREEECNILWWLFGEHSLTDDKHFSVWALPAACIIGPVELASLTKQIPGPLAARAVLAKLLRLADPSFKPTTSIQTAVSACDLEWRKTYLKPHDSVVDLCPISAAISYSTEYQDWGSFQRSAGIDVTKDFRSLDLAEQMYREALIAKLYARSE